MDPILQTWFAHPRLLAGLAAVPLLATFFTYAWFRRRRAVAALGSTLGVRRQVLLRPGVRRWRGLMFLGAAALLALAAAGPQWGREYGASRAAGDDLVVALDLSASMSAEQPSRRERALRLLRDLAGTLAQHGGRRVALVAFAAEARLLFPLTQDYDHFRHALSQIEDDDLPPLTPAPDEPFRSGTRFGAALRMAVAAGDPARAGRQAILLVSDGDDPADTDGEWLEGVQAARAKGVRVFTVGVGDPEATATIPSGGDVLRYQGQEVRSRLNEALLEDVARRTGGAYLPARTHLLPLGTLLENLLAQHPAETDDAGDGLPVYQQRYAWFLAPALALLLASLLLNEGPSRGRRAPVLAAAMTALLAGTGLPDAEPLVRDGNAAFAAGDFEAALRYYDQAEGNASDPGVVAFNRAAACFRLGRYAEAAAGYRQCLEDDQAPAPRRARAYYDLGTTLLGQAAGTSGGLLRQAVTAFRGCLAQPELDAELRASARYNLELAQRLWLKARAANPEEPPDGEGLRPPDPGPAAPGDDPKTPTGKEPGTQGDNPDDGNGGKTEPGDGARDKAANRALQVLPDTDEVVPLPPAATDAQLDGVIDRIRRERRSFWQRSTRPPADARNW